MPSQDKLIKQGLKYTDSLFEEISKRLEQGVKASDTLEAFLDKYNKAFPDNGNPLISLNYDSEMLKLIISETNNHKFSRPAQKELVRVTIEDQVGELITRVGDDIKDSVRDIVKEGYNNNLSQDEIAANISDRVSTIKGKRAKAIARTEIARTATVSDYVINKERGATHFYVECRNTACPVCKANWLKNPDKEATGKGLMGDRIYSMNDTAMLPPVHPNCRCVAYFVNKEGDAVEPGTSTNQEPTKEQLRQNLTPAERTKYANYKRLVDSHTKWLRDNPDADAKAIENHKRKLATAQANLNELRVKALGGSIGGTAKPKPKPKPKPKEEPKEERNPKKKETSEKEKKESTETKPKEKEIPKQPKSKLKFDELTSPEEVAEYFGFEYSFGGFPQVSPENEVMTGKDGKRYFVGKNENKRGKYHKFYDRENDCTIYFAQSLTKPSKSKDFKGKIYIDITNSNNGVKNLKDVVQMYWDSPKVLKEANTSITFTNRRAKRLYAYNKLMDKVWVNNLKDNRAFEKEITHGKNPAWIDMYINSIEDNPTLGHSMQRTLYHEMAHGLDNLLSSAWDNRGRFSDNRNEDGYAALVHKQPVFDEKTKRRIGFTSEDIVDGFSSRYGRDHWRKTFSCSEDFADAISMVSFKHIKDKTGAIILPSDWSWTNGAKALTYEEWIAEYNHKLKYLEEVLNI